MCIQIFIIYLVIIFASLIFYSEKIAAGSDGKNGMSSVIDTGSLYSKDSNENQFFSIIGFYFYFNYVKYPFNFFFNFLEAIWFSIASLTTVGFGDICPK